MDVRWVDLQIQWLQEGTCESVTGAHLDFAGEVVLLTSVLEGVPQGRG